MSKKPPTSSCASHVPVAFLLLVNVHRVDIGTSWVQQECKPSCMPENHKVQLRIRDHVFALKLRRFVRQCIYRKTQHV